MGLLEIRQYIQERQSVSLQDIAFHFKKQPNELEAMLSKLVQKKQISKNLTGNCSSGGCGCKCGKDTEAKHIFYSWNI